MPWGRFTGEGVFQPIPSHKQSDLETTTGEEGGEEGPKNLKTKKTNIKSFKYIENTRQG